MDMDVLNFDARAGRRVAELIEGVGAEQFDGPTPCEAWTVRDLVTHLVAGNAKYTGIANGADFAPGAPEVSLGADWAETYRTSLDTMLAAWRQPGALDREIGLPRGARGRGEVAAWIHLAETVGHGWDLAVATGQEPGFPDDVVAATLEECRARMPAQRGEGSPFQDAVPDEPRTPIDRLAAFLGRDVNRWRS